jgi:hypothetical protein
MAYSQLQIQQAALREATMVGNDPHASPVIDASVVLEDLFYEALRQAVVIGASNQNEAGSLKRVYPLLIVDGVADLPDTVVTECLDSSSVFATDDVTQLSSYQSRFNDYLRPGHDLLNYYAVQGNQFYFREAGDDAGVFDGTINLVAIGTPDIPAAIADPITISTETAERTIKILAQMLRGAAANA